MRRLRTAVATEAPHRSSGCKSIRPSCETEELRPAAAIAGAVSAAGASAEAGRVKVAREAAGASAAGRVKVAVAAVEEAEATAAVAVVMEAGARLFDF